MSRKQGSQARHFPTNYRYFRSIIIPSPFVFTNKRSFCRYFFQW